MKDFFKEKLGINIDIRLQNPQFIAMIFMAIIVPIVGYFGMNLSDITSWTILIDTLVKGITNPYLLAMVICNVYNCVIDPTTKGMKDSETVIDKMLLTHSTADEIRELQTLLAIKEAELEEFRTIEY